MNWYIAKIVFNICIDDARNHTQFDEQCRIISAISKQEAMQKALAIGRNEEEEFVNMEKQKVEWKFIDVLDVFEVKEWKDGSKIYASTHEEEEPLHYILYVMQRAKSLRMEFSDTGVQQAMESEA